jgi:hypothetical protein
MGLDISMPGQVGLRKHSASRASRCSGDYKIDYSKNKFGWLFLKIEWRSECFDYPGGVEMGCDRPVRINKSENGVHSMNKRFISMLALVALCAASGLSRAQERKAVDKASPKLFIGKVTQVDERTKAVTMQGKGGEKVTLNFSNPKTGTCPGGRKPVAWTALPKVGDVLIARYSSDCDDCLATC